MVPPRVILGVALAACEVERCDGEAKPKANARAPLWWSEGCGVVVIRGCVKPSRCTGSGGAVEPCALQGVRVGEDGRVSVGVHRVTSIVLGKGGQSEMGNGSVYNGIDTGYSVMNLYRR